MTMNNKSVATIVGLFLLGGCHPAAAQDRQIFDHFKNVIEQKPYHVEVCRNVSMSGDKTGDTLGGAIIGGILGKALTGNDDGAKIGALFGGIVGHNESNKVAGTRRVCKTEIRYKEEVRTIYSHSHIEFWYEGRKYNLKFKK